MKTPREAAKRAITNLDLFYYYGIKQGDCTNKYD
jgi:hypothetical protein